LLASITVGSINGPTGMQPAHSTVAFSYYAVDLYQKTVQNEAAHKP